jgi:DNA-binding CsgD family transcriptional regulator
LTEEYDLKKSVEGVGKLVPILKDTQGNIIDGFHRIEVDPKWPSITVDTVDNAVKLELARLAVNFDRRTMSKDEMDKRVAFLIGAGLTPEEIHEQTGVSISTIYRHMPQDLKNQQKVNAGKVSGSVRTCEHTVKTSDIPPVVMVECERCHISTSEPKEWHGHQLCETHYKGAELNPEFYETFFGYLDKAKMPKVPEKLIEHYDGDRTKSIEKWSDREAKMHPQHSKTEENVLQALVTKGVRNIAQDRHFCVRETVPDLYFPEKNLAVYLDFEETHKKREDKDEQLREWLTKCHGVRVLSLPYDAVSQKETDRLVQAIIEEVS